MITATVSSTYPPDDLPIVVQDRRRRGFYTIDNEVIDRYGTVLKAHGVAVLNVLARFANRDGECFPSQSTIAKRLGMCRMQVSREINKLEKLHLIEVEPQFGPNGEQRANLYILCDIPKATEPVTHRYTPGNSELHPPVTERDTPCNRQLHKQNTKKNTQTEQDPEKQHAVVVATVCSDSPNLLNEQKIETAETVRETNDDNRLSAALLAIGLAKSVVQHLVQAYSEEYIGEKLSYLTYLQATQPEKVLKPCGWLRKAIEEDYAAPDGYGSIEEQAVESVEIQHLEEALQQEFEEQQRRNDEERTRQEQEAAAQLATIRATYGTTEQELAVWQQIRNELKLTVPTATFTRYFAETMLLSVQNGEALIGLPNKYGCDWLVNRFGKKLAYALSAHLDGQSYTVKFIDLSVATQG